MTAVELIKEMKALPAQERAQVVKQAIQELAADERKSIERLLRRLQHPDVPEAFWQGVEDHEEGRTVDLETALRETPPGRK
jgi:hypothetical protein